MDDSQNTVSVPPTSPVQDDAPVKDAPVENVENVEVAKPDTQPTSEADVKKEETGKVAEPEAPVAKEDNDFNSLKGKVSSLEKERNELRKKAELFDALDKIAAKDPEFMKSANERLVKEGYLDPSVMEKINQQGVTPQGTTPDISQHPAIQWAQQKQKEEFEQRRKFFADFQSDKPDLEEGDTESVSAKMNAISAAARLNINKGLSEKDAYNQAYLQILHPEKIKEMAELSGMAKAQSVTPSIGGASGTKATGSGTLNLSEEEKAIAASMGLSEEAYAEGKSL